MKKTCLVLLAILLCCLMCACDPSHSTIGLEAAGTVVSAELIQYENPARTAFMLWGTNHFDELQPFDSTKATVLEVLPEDKIDDLWDTLSDTRMLCSYYGYDSPSDVCLRLNYENGDFLIIWANYAEGSHAGYIGEYASDGTVLSFLGSFASVSDYENIVEQYFDYTFAS